MADTPVTRALAAAAAGGAGRADGSADGPVRCFSNETQLAGGLNLYRTDTAADGSTKTVPVSGLPPLATVIKKETPRPDRPAAGEADKPPMWLVTTPGRPADAGTSVRGGNNPDGAGETADAQGKSVATLAAGSDFSIAMHVGGVPVRCKRFCDPTDDPSKIAFRAINNTSVPMAITMQLVEPAGSPELLVAELSPFAVLRLPVPLDGVNSVIFRLRRGDPKLVKAMGKHFERAAGPTPPEPAALTAWAAEQVAAGVPEGELMPFMSATWRRGGNIVLATRLSVLNTTFVIEPATTAGKVDADLARDEALSNARMSITGRPLGFVGTVLMRAAMAAGATGLAGVVGALVTTPLQVATLLQRVPDGSGGDCPSLTAALARRVDRFGVSSLWKLLSLDIVESCTDTITEVGFDAGVRLLIGEHPSARTAGIVQALRPAWLVVATSATSAPLITARTLMLMEPGRYAGAVDCLRKVYRAEGVAGFFRGFAPNVIGCAASLAGMYAIKLMADPLIRKLRAWRSRRAIAAHAAAAATDAAAAGPAPKQYDPVADEEPAASLTGLPKLGFVMFAEFAACLVYTPFGMASDRAICRNLRPFGAAGAGAGVGSSTAFGPLGLNFISSWRAVARQDGVAKGLFGSLASTTTNQILRTLTLDVAMRPAEFAVVFTQAVLASAAEQMRHILRTHAAREATERARAGASS